MSEQELLESLVEYLIEESYVDSEESALVLVEHLSNDALENILMEKAASEATGNKYRSNPELRRQRIEQEKKAAQSQFKNKKPPSKLNLGGVQGQGGKLTSKVTQKTGQKVGQKVAQKAARKGLSRFIPGVGTAMGIKDAVTRAKKGDYVGAALSGVSAIPGPIGWAGTAADIARDVTKGKPETKTVTKPETKTVTKPETKTTTITKPETKTTTITKPETKTQTQTQTQTKVKDKTKVQDQIKVKEKPETQTQTKRKIPIPPSPVKTKVKDPGTTKKRKPRRVRFPGIPLGSVSKGGTTRAIGGHISKARDPNESFEMVCDFLIQEGYAETGPQAEAMYNHMSAEWMEFIHEQF